MVVIPGPVEFVMGAPSTEAGWIGNEQLHKQRIGRTFVLSAKSVTLAEFRKCKPRYGIGEIEPWAPTADSPAAGTNWFHAAEYCNWLSKQEGLPESEWCYEPFHDPKAWPAFAVSSVGLLHSPWGPAVLLALGGMYPGRLDAKYEGGMRLASNYLRRHGYRLPTGAEMEYATRAGAATSRYYGETDELLRKYACYKSSVQVMLPVGTLKPNDLGLFDAHGNVFTWCQETFKPYAVAKGDEAVEDQEDDLLVTSNGTRELRGGSFLSLASVVRSALRYNLPPTLRSPEYAFRVARTLELGSLPAHPPNTGGSHK